MRRSVRCPLAFSPRWRPVFQLLPAEAPSIPVATGLLASILLPAILPAQVYHVATTGNDTTGNGSAGAPWATVNKAVTTVPDGAEIQVAPGLYNQRISLSRQFASGIVVRAVPAYQARFRYNGGATLICYYGQNVTVEGFDIAHDPANTGGLVIQIQDLLGATPGPGPTGTDIRVGGIVLRNNIIHDSTNNDLLKINNGCTNILVEGNIFYNQFGSDEHIDINSVDNITVRNNIFFNDFEASGRVNPGNTSGYIVSKDSNGNSDNIEGNKDILIENNVFLHWQGGDSTGFIMIGEDSTAFYETDGAIIQNNLFLGDGSQLSRSAISIRGSRDILVRNNTITGNLPTRSYALRLIRLGANQQNTDIRLFNNVWSDPTGTMGTEGFNNVDFAESPPADNDVVVLLNNAYWNNGAALPADSAQEVRIVDDTARVTTNPNLPALGSLTVRPVWNAASGQFGGGYATIEQARVALINAYGRPTAGSSLLGAADPAQAPPDDILGNPRTARPVDIGAVQMSLPATTTPSNLSVY